jgi:hypothetical protein
MWVPNGRLVGNAARPLLRTPNAGENAALLTMSLTRGMKRGKRDYTVIYQNKGREGRTRSQDHAFDAQLEHNGVEVDQKTESVRRPLATIRHDPGAPAAAANFSAQPLLWRMSRACYARSAP